MTRPSGGGEPNLAKAATTGESPPSDPWWEPTPEHFLPEGSESLEPDISVGASRIAVTGFGSSVLYLALLAVIVLLEAGGPGAPGPLFGIAFACLLLGFLLSIVGLSKRHRISPERHKLAIAGLIISVISIVALPFLLVVAFAMFTGDFFT